LDKAKHNNWYWNIYTPVIFLQTLFPAAKINTSICWPTLPGKALPVLCLHSVGFLIVNFMVRVTEGSISLAALPAWFIIRWYFQQYLAGYNIKISFINSHGLQINP
jgi:hypothetical protein